MKVPRTIAPHTGSPAPEGQAIDPAALASLIKRWGEELGFQQVGIAGITLGEDEAHLREWLSRGWHGDMDYMARHGMCRSRPADLVPGTLRVVSVRMDYLPPSARDAWAVMRDPERGFISRYALGRDYHKTLRQRLQKLADRIVAAVGPFGYRVFVDSAPVLEKALARDAGLGWIGKHTNLLAIRNLSKVDARRSTVLLRSGRSRLRLR